MREKPKMKSKRILKFAGPIALLFISLVLLLASVLTTFLPAIASAASKSLSSDNLNHIEANLTGTKGGTSYQVQAKSGSGSSYTFSAKSATDFISPVLPGTGSNCAGSQAVKLANTFQVTVSSNSKTVGSSTVSLCDGGVGYTYSTSIQVSSSPTQTQNGTVSGCITYKDDQGKSQPFKHDATGQLKGNGQTYPLKFSDNGCITTISNLKPGTYTISADYQVPGGQSQNYTKTFTLGAVAGNVVKPGNGQDPNAQTGKDTKQLDCDTQFDNPLTWIICPVVDTLASMIDAVDKIITNQLEINTSNIFCSDQTCQAYYTAWKSFRNIALGLMAIAGLVIVISQALGLEILDAYTVRKTLPRVLVAAIGITLSWQLMKLAVEISNDLGFGVRHLIYAPFADLKDKLDLSFAGKGFANFIFGTLAVGGGAITLATFWLVAGGIGVLLSYVATAGLAVLIAVIVLILRQVAITMLMFFAPLAIVSYVFPNTQRIYKFWWESFSKALLMFPLIAGFIAAGRVFSAISLSSGGAFNQLIGFLAYFAPYFLIPATFKLAGGALRQIGGFVNDRSRGGFDRLRGYRANQAKSRLARVRNKGLYRGANRLQRAMNQLGFVTWNGDEQLPYLAGAHGGWLGKKLFGRTAADMAGRKAVERNGHIAKAAEESRLSYQAGWAALGQLDSKHAGNGLTERGRRELVGAGLARWAQKDENGNDIVGGEIEGDPVKNGDFGHLDKMADIMTANSLDGSIAQFAAQDLKTKAGIITSYGNKSENQRAETASIAAAAVAREGKLDPAMAARLHAATINGNPDDPVNKSFADWELAQQQQLAAQYRIDSRPGKGIRMDRHGKAIPISEAYENEHGEYVLTDEPGKKGVSSASFDAAETVKNSSITSIKADSIPNLSPAMISMMKGEHSDWMKDGTMSPTEMKKFVKYNAEHSIYGSGDVNIAFKKVMAEAIEAGVRFDEVETHAPTEQDQFQQLELGKPPEPPPDQPPG
jgi:hypothetical protein